MRAPDGLTAEQRLRWLVITYVPPVVNAVAGSYLAFVVCAGRLW